MSAQPGGARIRAVIFDYGGVISSFDVGSFFRTIGLRSGKTPEELGALVLGSDLPRLYESGRITSGEFHAEICRICGVQVSEEEFASAFVSIFTPIESTIDLIRRLKGTHRLGLLSNTNEWHFERCIRRMGVFPLFDAVTLSYRVKAMKPAEEIYRDCLGKIGFRPEECVFVDDLEENVLGARRLDIRAIRYAGHEALLSSLAELGVLA